MQAEQAMSIRAMVEMGGNLFSARGPWRDAARDFGDVVSTRRLVLPLKASCGVHYTPSGLLQSANSPQSAGISPGLVLDAQAAHRAQQRGRSRVSKYRRSDLEGAPYGRELELRLRLLVVKAPEFSF